MSIYTFVPNTFLTAEQLNGNFSDVSGSITAHIANTSNPHNTTSAQTSFIQTGTGAVSRTAQSKMRDVVSVKDFGAVGDGVADDTSAIQAAINANVAVYFPKGIYICSNKITKTGGIFNIYGDGSRFSEIRFTGASASNSGFSYSLPVTATLSTDSCIVSGVSITTSTGYAVGKTALYLDGSAQITGGILQDRSNRRAFIFDVAVSGLNSSLNSGWGTGVYFYSVGWFIVENFLFLGDFSQGNISGNWAGYGIRIGGPGIPVEGKITNSAFYSAEIGIFVPDYFEGLYASTIDMVNVQQGIYAAYAAGISTIPEVDCGLLQPSIHHVHINCRRNGVFIKSVNQGSITCCNIYVEPKAGDVNFAGIFLVNGATNFISNNAIRNANPSNTTTLAWGIVLSSQTRCQITNNTPSYFNGAGIFLVSNSDNNVVSQNILESSTYSVASDATDNGNIVTYNKSISITGTPYNLSAGNIIVVSQFSSQYVVTLTGGASTEVVTFSVASGVFSSKPTSAFSDIAGSDEYICSYDFSGSSATSLVFKIRKITAGSIPNGLQRFSVSASE